MLSPPELDLLDAVLDRLLPVEDGGAMRAYVRERATRQEDLYRTGLIAAAELGLDRIGDLEGHPSVALILQHAVEGYYTSAAGMADVGFRVRA